MLVNFGLPPTDKLTVMDNLVHLRTHTNPHSNSQYVREKQARRDTTGASEWKSPCCCRFIISLMVRWPLPFCFIMMQSIQSLPTTTCSDARWLTRLLVALFTCRVVCVSTSTSTSASAPLESLKLQKSTRRILSTLEAVVVRRRRRRRKARTLAPTSRHLVVVVFALMT